LWPVTKTAGMYDGSNNRNKNNINIPRQGKATESNGKRGKNNNNNNNNNNDDEIKFSVNR
jgi:hypothetical protein